MQMRQGDIFFETVDSIPAQAVQIKSKNRYILAEGEATGHHHSVAVLPGVKMYEHEGTLYLRVQRDDVQVEHQEHNPIELGRGTYKITRQREYTSTAVRQVAD